MTAAGSGTPSPRDAGSLVEVGAQRAVSGTADNTRFARGHANREPPRVNPRSRT